MFKAIDRGYSRYAEETPRHYQGVGLAVEESLKPGPAYIEPKLSFSIEPQDGFHLGMLFEKSISLVQGSVFGHFHRTQLLMVSPWTVKSTTNHSLLVGLVDSDNGCPTLNIGVCLQSTDIRAKL